MKRIGRYTGLALIVIGTFWLLADLFWGFMHLNLMLVVPLFLMIAGVFLHVWMQKRESRY
jgi:hypothetical protein